MMARARLLAVMALLLAGAIGVISSTQTWLTVTLVDDIHGVLAIPGASALPVLAPLSLATLALGAALTIVGRVTRYVLGVLSVLISAGAGWASLIIAIELPARAASQVITETTGISGLESTATLVTSIAATPWPALTVAVWLLALAAGLLVLATAHQWSDGGRKYRTDERGGPSRRDDGRPVDAIDSWDDLSHGSDPTT